jgi:nickel/cobalt transporter (NicO) family protein
MRWVELLFSPVPLLLAAAFVGILHMSAPDHWVTLIILGRVSKWNRSQLMGVGVMTAVGHVVLSILLGFVVVEVGILFSQQLSTYITEATGAIMVIGGLLYGARELMSRKTEDYDRETREKLSQGEGAIGKRFRYFAVLGAALSPDLSILPIFLLAVPIGVGFALDTAIVFAIASVAALLVFLLLGSAGLARAFEKLPPRYNDALVGFVIAAVGVYVLLAG